MCRPSPSRYGGKVVARYVCWARDWWEQKLKSRLWRARQHVFTRFVQYKNIRRESDRSQAAELNTFTRVGTAHLLSCSIVRESTATRLPPSPSVRYAARRVETLHVLCVLSDCASALHVHADLCGGWAAREKNVRREDERRAAWCTCAPGCGGNTKKDPGIRAATSSAAHKPARS